MTEPNVILTIAGSDPSGGAGIQADIKTISALGGYATAAMTALTVQNTQGVKAVEYMTPRLVEDQAEAVLQDMDVAAVKIGMTGTADIVHAIAAVLRRHPGIPVVLDPVMVSTSRHALMLDETAAALRHELLPLCTLCTPNLHEASVLLGEEVRTPAQMMNAARRLNRAHGCAFLIKGGHLEGTDRMVDVLYDGTVLQTYAAPRVDTRNLHGTGCTLSSAIATLLARDKDLGRAIAQAKEYITRAIQAAKDWHLGRGENGPLWHFA